MRRSDRNTFFDVRPVNTHQFCSKRIEISPV
jgi:hypothetical protein